MQNVPQSLGPYRVIALVAKGGQSQVFRGVDPRNGQPVALKVWLGARSRVRDERFAREVQAVRGLEHPNVVRCYDAGHDRGLPYLALEWIDGESLAHTLRRVGPLPIAEALRIGRALCEAVAHLHDHGLLHRDLKPDNVLLAGDGRVVLADFGLVFDVDPGQESLTATGNMLGTPGYWPPEQALGQRERIGVGSDVYGLGAVLYAALTARPPRAETDLQDMLASFHTTVDAPAELRPDVPPELDALVLECLASDPSERPTTARVVQRRLSEARPNPSTTPARRFPWLPRLVGAALALLAVLAAWLGRGQPPPEHQAPPADPAATARTSVVRLTPLDGRDTYVVGWGFYTDDNYEGFPRIRVGYRTQGRPSEAWGYLRLPDLALDGELRRATLRLYAGGGAPDLELAVYPVVGTWIEGSGRQDGDLDGMAWGPEGATGPFDARFSRAECAPEPILVIPAPRAQRWIELDLSATLQRWERTPEAKRVLCLRPATPTGQPRPERSVMSFAGRHDDREVWPQLVLEHTGVLTLPVPFDERWEARREALRSELASLAAPESEQRVEALLRETPGDVWLHVQRGRAALQRGAVMPATRDLEVARELAATDWTAHDPELAEFAREVFEAHLEPLDPRDTMHTYNTWVWAWELTEPGSTPRPFPDAPVRRALLQRRFLVYAHLADVPEHLTRGVELWPDDVMLRQELDELPGLVTAAVGELWSQGAQDKARVLAGEALEQLAVTPAQRERLERYAR